MNNIIINASVLNRALANMKKDLEKDRDDSAKIKRMITQEALKLIRSTLGERNFSGNIYMGGGLSKEQLLIKLEEVFGKDNFLDGQYRGGKQLIVEVIEELFDKKSFANGKYQGGWNESQDTANIHKVFKPENFTNGEYTGGWNEKQDAQSLKESLTNGEAKTLASQLIEQKLGGAEKFQEGIYQSETEITQVVKKGLQNKGEILRTLHDIIGADKFYSEEGGENVPAGREGKYKDDREIALLQAKYQAEIQATQEWLKFFKKHLIPSDKETLWRDKFGSNVEGAEDLYEDAKSKGKQVVGTDFEDDEKRRIDKEAHTPEEIQKVLAEIPTQRRKLAWDKFFRDHESDGRINKEWESNWRNSELSIQLAEKIYNNGWNNSPNGLINKERLIENYTTKTIVKGNEYEKSTKNINPLKHLAEEIDKVHNFIVERIDLQTNLDKFPTDEEIKSAYLEKQVPDLINYEEIKILRDQKIKSLFKQYFQGANATNLDDQSIELWRVSPTGLPNTGLDQRKAYDNGWINPAEITDSKTSYCGIANIEVLKTKKADIDQEIGKVDSLVKKIIDYKLLRDLDANQAEIDKQFDALKREFLPPNKDQEITNSVKEKRKTLWYSLTDPQDGGLDEETLKKLFANLQNTWNVPNYEPMTVKKLNEFIAADKDVQAMDLFKEEDKWEDLNESGWLKQQGGYELPKGITAAEEKLHRDQKGAFLLKFFYEKCKDFQGYPFNPDKLNNKLFHFCQIGTKMVDKYKPALIGKGTWESVPTEVIGGDKGNVGHLAIGTGVGKTTKTVNCLVNGGQRHVILVTPTRGLADSAFGHHVSWLQRWGCVYHGGAKGVTEMAYCLKNSYTKATEQEIAEGKAESEMKSIYVSHGTYPVAKNDLAYWYNANTNKKEGMEEGKKGLSVMYYGFLAAFQARNLFVKSGGIDSWTDENLKRSIKEKLIPEDDAIIFFDEAHFNIPAYKALAFRMVKHGYETLVASATFPGAEFSTTSTYPIKRVFSGHLDPNMPAGLMKIDNSEQAEKLETLRGVPIGSIKWQDDNGFPIGVEVNLEERIQIGRTWIFGKGLRISDEQRRLLGNNVAYMTYTPEFDATCEDVSAGRPNGSTDIVDYTKEMGYTPPTLDTVISLGVTETTNLGKYFTYSDPKLGLTPISSLIQQMGRVGRVKWGLAISLTKKCGEIDISDDVSAAMIEALFTGDVKKIHEKDYQQIYDVDILRGAMAYPDPKTFGKAPEEILMGLKITKEQQNKKEKLTQLVWRQDNDIDKNEAMAKPWYASMSRDINPSEKLWNRYLGKSEAITMGEEQSKNLLKEMISNFITQDRNYPQGLNLKKQPEFINSVFGTKLDGGKKDEVIKETRTVLNGLVEVKVNELAAKDYDETNKRSKNPNTIKKLTGLLKLTQAQIDYQKMKNDEGKLVWTLLMKTS